MSMRSYLLKTTLPFDKIKEVVYNTLGLVKPERVLELATKDYPLKPNDEMKYLYGKCKKIRPLVISEIALVPEFMDALRNYKLEYNDESVYEIIKNSYRKILSEGKSYRTARAVVNKISKDVKGTPSAWRWDNKLSLPTDIIDNLLSFQPFVAEINLLIVSNDFKVAEIEIFEVIKKLYFPRLKNGIETSATVGMAEAIEIFSEILFDKKDAWKKDYRKWLIE